MRVIYMDVLFLLNLAVDYLLLLLTATVSGVYQKRTRLLAGALAGAVLAVVGYFLPLQMMFALVFRVCSCALIVRIAFGKRKIRTWFRLCGIFLLLTALLAGIIFGLSANGEESFLQNGVPYFEISLPLMLLAFLVIYLLSGLVLGKGRAEVGRSYRQITASMGQRRITFRALTDSGNLLRDPITGQRVMVVCGETLSGLFEGAGETLLQNLGSYPPEELLPLLRRCCKTAFWILPVHTAAEDSLILVFRPEELYIDDKKSTEYLLGITPKALEIGNDCCALMGV